MQKEIKFRYNVRNQQSIWRRKGEYCAIEWYASWYVNQQFWQLTITFSGLWINFGVLSPNVKCAFECFQSMNIDVDRTISFLESIERSMILNHFPHFCYWVRQIFKFSVESSFWHTVMRQKGMVMIQRCCISWWEAKKRTDCAEIGDILRYFFERIRILGIQINNYFPHWSSFEFRTILEGPIHFANLRAAAASSGAFQMLISRKFF